MDPAIERIISHAFYDDKLATYEKRAREAETELPPFVNLNPMPPSPVLVVDFEHVSSSGAGANFERGKPRWHNPSEIDSVMDVLRHVRARPGKKKPTLAILAPYKAQVDKLHSRVESLIGH
jgi:superfamily I DNA and/or RNA helicase